MEFYSMTKSLICNVSILYHFYDIRRPVSLKLVLEVILGVSDLDWI